MKKVPIDGTSFVIWDFPGFFDTGGPTTEFRNAVAICEEEGSSAKNSSCTWSMLKCIMSRSLFSAAGSRAMLNLPCMGVVSAENIQHLFLSHFVLHLIEWVKHDVIEFASYLLPLFCESRMNVFAIRRLSELHRLC